MKSLITTISALVLVGGCETSSGTRRSEITECPIGMVLICETKRDRDLSRGGDDEIPEPERCYCEQIQRN